MGGMAPSFASLVPRKLPWLGTVGARPSGTKFHFLRVVHRSTTRFKKGSGSCISLIMIVVIKAGC